MACGNRPHPEANTHAVSHDERITELARQLRETRATLECYKAVTDVRLQTAETRLAEQKRVEDELRRQVDDLTAKNATLEERSRRQEKISDRARPLWLAALGFGFGLLSLLVTAALQLKK